jgi:hypothetical protein
MNKLKNLFKALLLSSLLVFAITLIPDRGFTVSGTAHTHTGGTANCRNQATCSICGQKYGTYGPHSIDTGFWDCDKYGHWQYCSICANKFNRGSHSGGRATCTSGGTCSTCGYPYLSALGHNMGAWYVSKAETCTEDGQNRRDCKRSGCNYYETSVRPKLGHDWSTVWSYDDSATGNHWHKCNRCSATTDARAMEFTFVSTESERLVRIAGAFVPVRIQQFLNSVV